jgi:hypothetical protein
MSWLEHHRRRLFAGFLASCVAQGLLPAARAEDPRWLRLHMPEASLETEVESTTEDYKVNGVKSTYEQLSLTPLVGLGVQGSIYHPNLLTFDLNGQGGWGWDNITARSPGVTQTRQASQDLQRYLFQFTLLRNKPYNASFVADRDHTHRDYGAFSTFTVDTSRYAGRINWNTASFDLYADMGTRTELDSGLTDSVQVDETYLNFNGTHKRKLGQTTLTYRFDEFDNTYGSRARQGSLNNAVGLSDTEVFGSRQQITAATGVGYNAAEYGGQQTETASASENLTVRHRPQLSTYFTMDYSHSSMASASSSRLEGVYGVRHQLYESLTSHLDAHGSYEDNASVSGTSSNDRYGLGESENYTKRLGNWGRLSIGMGLVADHLDFNSSGGLLTTIDEAHTLYLTTSTNYRPVYLNQPRVVVASVQVLGPHGIVVQENVDYQLVPAGQLTEIQLVQTSALLHDGDAVTVTYQSDSLNNASFEALNANLQIRLDLFSHYGVYGRLNWLKNNAPAAVLTESLTDLVGGMDYTWRWLRAGAEYEDYDSSYSQYTARRFYQNLSFRPEVDATLSLSLNQTFYHYNDGRDQTQYQFLTRYQIQLLTTLSWYVEGGYLIENVMGSDETMASARSGISWTRGKLSLRTDYEFNSQDTANGLWTQELVKNRIYAYMKRTF